MTWLIGWQIRVQLTTDGHGAYLGAVIGAFGIDVDYAQLVKHYGPTPDTTGPERKYSPGECCGIPSTGFWASPSRPLFQRPTSKSTIRPCANTCGVLRA